MENQNIKIMLKSFLNLNLIIVLLCVFENISAQTVSDSLSNFQGKKDNTVLSENNDIGLNCKSFIVPTALVGYGVATLSIKGFKQLNYSTRDEIKEHQPDHIRLDNYTQFAPAALVYGLSVAGIEGKHNFRDRSIIYSTSMLITSAITVPLKHIVKEERPDQSNRLSFPSGHTAVAFASAHFMYREYKDTNFLLSISGYSFAAFTGIYRMLNDKHWFGDVLAGAGFGIISTEFAYWLYPKINELISGKNNTSSTMVIPFYQNKMVGIGLVKSF